MIPIAGQSLEGDGHKFGLPTLPLPAGSHLKHREDPVVQQVTQLLMKDGKKSVAQRVSLHSASRPFPIAKAFSEHGNDTQ